MMDLSITMAHEERCKDLLHEAQRQNSIYNMHAGSTGSDALYRQMLASAGRVLLNWGCRLQIRGGAIVELSSVYPQRGYSL